MINCLFIEGVSLKIKGKIVGARANREVLIEGKNGYKILSPEPSQKLYNHSPDGFAWGYGGSGPSQLALAILLELFGQDMALAHYQEFKRDVIAAQAQDEDLSIEINDVYQWAKNKSYI